MEGIVPPYSSFSELREAVRFGYIEDVRSKLCVIRISEPTKPVSKFSRLLADAIQHRHLSILEFLLLERIPMTSDAVKAAAETRCFEALSMLFNHGWDINQPLSGDEPPVSSNVLDDFELVAWLLERGADPNAGCDVDETPLSHAVAAAPRPTVQVLLKKAATLEKGQLIYCAVDREIPDPELIEILAENGAPYEDILWQDAKSFRYRGHFTRGTPLHRACKSDNVAVARVLLKIGADPDKLSMKDNDQVPPTPRAIVYECRHPDMVMLFEESNIECTRFQDIK
ncbi:hypothetical protein LTR48_006518 [Friedmanniomyces endolithicus]|uniref:Ankyrin repeat protein n=1 Tax=Rachicladosporium monterosium TaxID=1507873 RepID=A0ABR0L0B1_9PEZI|nr:hypothetical protein LTR48_006518 [Friedmanniomyces endolithicus]KAK5141492.1 hypothetical protein LTR32_005956 [Rachicladosporium monterosium]